jgi:hypothetical protein
MKSSLDLQNYSVQQSGTNIINIREDVIDINSRHSGKLKYEISIGWKQRGIFISDKIFNFQLSSSPIAILYQTAVIKKNGYLHYVVPF